jgi:hypothetical protein
MEDYAGPTRRHGQTFHHGLCRGQKQDWVLRLGKAPQDRASSTRDFARRLQLIEGQRVQSWKNKHIARGGEGMNDGTQPFGPILAFSKKDHAFATRFLRLRKQVEGHHP